MRASPSLSQLWQPHSRLCQLCRVCEQQRSCSPGFCRKELHATESAVEVRRARRRLEDTVTDERVGVFTPDKDRCTADGTGRAAVIAARRGTVCGEVGRVPRFPSTQHPHPLYRFVIPVPFQVQRDGFRWRAFGLRPVEFQKMDTCGRRVEDTIQSHCRCHRRDHDPPSYTSP